MKLKSKIIIDDKINIGNSHPDDITSDIVDLNLLESKEEFENLITHGMKLLSQYGNLVVGFKILKSLIVVNGIDGLKTGLKIIHNITNQSNIVYYDEYDQESVYDWINLICINWLYGYQLKIANEEEYEEIVSLLPTNYNFEKFINSLKNIIQTEESPVESEPILENE